MRSNLGGGYFVQNSPQDRENRLFGVFGPFLAPDGPGRGGEISLSPPDPPKPVYRELPEKILITTQRRQSKKVAQRERGSDGPKIGGGGGGGAGFWEVLA